MDIVTHALAGACVGRAIAAAAAPQWEGPLGALGALAGMAPDLDFVFELRGKLAAWRYHRVALHGVPVALGLSALIAAGAALTPAAPAGLPLLAAVSALAVLSHLVLDAVTSFGTALAFPLSQRRFSSRSHFIVDPVVLLALAAGLRWERPARALAACAAYGVACWLLRSLVEKAAARSLAAAGVEARVSIEPRFLAPLRWLAVADTGDAYLLARCTPLGVGPWTTTTSGAGSGAELAARKDPLLAAFLATCDFPRFELRESTLVVEDVKWWLELPLRPLAFRARLDEDGVPREVRQGRMFARGPLGHSEDPPASPLVAGA